MCVYIFAINIDVSLITNSGTCIYIKTHPNAQNDGNRARALNSFWKT